MAECTHKHISIACALDKHSSSDHIRCLSKDTMDPIDVSFDFLVICGLEDCVEQHFEPKFWSYCLLPTDVIPVHTNATITENSTNQHCHVKLLLDDISDGEEANPENADTIMSMI